MRMFCPVMKPAWAEQRKAQAAPNSAGSPIRFAGMLAMLRARLSNDPGRELGIAAEEQMKITRIRLEKLLDGGS